MIKPSMSNIPGMGAMTDTLDFVKNLWSGMSVPGMGLPGMVMPTLSVDEINKQITDLKAVESWLTLNMNMLRATIQALEVQSATISTLQSMGQTLSAAVAPNPPKTPAADPQAAKDSPFSFPQAAPKPQPQADQPPPAAAQAAKNVATEAAAQAANPAVWWNMLQDQFKQAVNTAMAPEPTPAAPVKAARPKPAARARKRKAMPKKG